MKSIIIFILTFLFLNQISASQNSNWYLMWHDDFNGEVLDETKWNVLNVALDKNNELQYYSKEDVFLDKGCLVLRSQKRKKGDRNYTSGLVDTKSKFAFKYGKIEIRAKLPKGQGIWPAHWMLSASGNWPPEIDIMETFGEIPSNILMTNHFLVNGQHRIEGNEKNFKINFSEDFHVFALEWNPKELKWSIDGVTYFTTNNNVPNEMFYIILNTAVGGDLPGFPDETTVFPQFHFIDSIKVYKKEIKGTKILYTKAQNGYVSVNPSERRFKIGTKANLTAIPKIGYKFKLWQGDILETENPCDIFMHTHKNIEAVFIEDETFPNKISQDKDVTASSIEREGLDPLNITDGDYSTRWSSNFHDLEWITIDLKNQCQVAAIGINWESAYGKNYEIQTSINGETWETVKSVENNTELINEFYFPNIESRFIRLNCLKRGTEWGFSILELEVYGKELES